VIRRWLFNVASTVSLLLCGLVTAAYIWSYYASYRFMWASGGHCSIIYISNGSLRRDEFSNWPTTEPLTWRYGSDPGPRIECFWNSTSVYDWVLLDRQGHLAIVPPPTDWRWRAVPPATGWSQPMPLPLESDSHFSNWIAITALLPAARAYVRLLHAVRHNRRRLRGLCPNCSYNLTGNTSEICPECGTHLAEVRCV